MSSTTARERLQGTHRLVHLHTKHVRLCAACVRVCVLQFESAIHGEKRESDREKTYDTAVRPRNGRNRGFVRPRRILTKISLRRKIKDIRAK